jgi:NAD-dependent deacetylase
MTPGFPAAVVEALRGAGHVAVLTGAGVSAESGIPTFRDALTGIWATFDPDELATPAAFARNPGLVWRWYRERRIAIRAARPNPAHHALARLERLVPQLTLVTQNIDGLHARAGSADVVELHGNIARVKCAEEDRVVEQFEDTDEVPRCGRCGGFLRPDVVWFGELLPFEALERASDAARSCDVFLSVGTSNLVEPAASLPWTAVRHGALVAVINTSDEGQHSGPRVHHLLGKAGEVLPALLLAAWPEASMTMP